MMKTAFPAYIGLKRDFKDFATLRDDNIILRDGWRIGKNECSHMGMRFMTPDKQITEPCIIKCPYHGRNMSSIKMEEVGEMLLNSSTALNPVLASVLADLGEEYQTIYSEVECPWYVWMQNTMDQDHLGFVHRGGFDSVFDLDSPFFHALTTDGYSLHYKAVDSKLFERMKDHSSPQNHYFSHWTLPPNLSITSFCGILHSIEEIYPVNHPPDTQDQTCRVKTRYFASIKGKPDWAIIKAAKQNNKKIIEEDISICERVAPTFKKPEKYLESEIRIEHFHAYLTQQGIFL